MAHTDPNDVIDEFTGGAPRASEWHTLRAALVDRVRGLRRQQEGETELAARAALETQISALKRQIKTLETEEVVARFVEDSIKVSLARAPLDLEEDDEG
jgi:hypothetical protein